MGSNLKKAIEEYESVESAHQEMTRSKIADRKEIGHELAFDNFPAAVSKRVKQLSRKLSDAPLIVPETPSFSAWHFSASIAFEQYKLIVGGCSYSNDPAVLFIQSVLSRLGLGTRSVDAIKKALHRFGDLCEADPLLLLRSLGLETLRADPEAG